MYSLLVDIGNTAIKLGLSKDELSSQVSWPHLNQEDLKTKLKSYLSPLTQNLAQALICSVSSYEEIVLKVLKEELSCPLKLILRDLSLPLGNLYYEPKKLGPDRLVAAFAAQKLYPEKKSQLIVDLGTAITLDAVYEQKFQGGLIIPGPQIALEALAEKTDRLPKLSFQTDFTELKLGQSTEEGMLLGSYFGLLAELQGLILNLTSKLPKPCIILATGGLAEKLAPRLKIFQAVHPNLVLTGLHFLAKSNPSAFLT
ncbi:MAG: type III pantothenate kinase [Desulfovibrionaceae bacterium]|nr:type III pantothenate kinase [Desulfovibrionaceae bacterium]